MGKENFLKPKEIFEEGIQVSGKEIARDRIRKLEAYLGTAWNIIHDDTSNLITWGEGIKESYPQLSDKEIRDIFLKAKYEAAPKYERERQNINNAISSVLEKSTPQKQSKYRTRCKEFLYKKISEDALATKKVFEQQKEQLEASGKFNESMTNPSFQFQLAFEDFFEPVIMRKKIEQKTNDLELQIQELGQQFHKVDQDRSSSKDARKQKGIEIQEKLHKIKKELKSNKEKLEAAQIIAANLIPSKEEHPLPKLYNELFRKFIAEHSDKE